MISRVWHGWTEPIMRFDNLDAVRVFAGEDYEACVVPPAARAILSRFDQRSAHYEVMVEM